MIAKSPQGRPVQDGYRRTLQHAIQWYEVLLSHHDLEAERRVARARCAVDLPDAHTANAPDVRRRLPPREAQLRSTAIAPTAPLRRIPFPTCEDVPDEDDGHEGADSGDEMEMSDPADVPSVDVPPPPPLSYWKQVALALGFTLSGRTQVSDDLAQRCPICFGPGRPPRTVLEYVHRFPVLGY